MLTLSQKAAIHQAASNNGTIEKAQLDAKTRQAVEAEFRRAEAAKNK